MEKEIWKPAKWFSKYEVSSLWNIRLKRTGKNRKLITNGYGYVRACLMSDWSNRTEMVSVHRLVFFSFNEFDMKFDSWKNCVCHKDDVKSNNSIENLFLWTQMENLQDMRKKWRMRDRFGNAYRVLSENDIREIFRLRKNGRTMIEIGKMFEKDASNISRIISSERWSHLKSA